MGSDPRANRRDSCQTSDLGPANSVIGRIQRSVSCAPDAHAGTLPARRRATLPFLRMFRAPALRCA
eukprot:38821-Prymnesium_polylepis.1